ncbi:MAG: DUF4145 domain-containing protein [Beijerinckiaceae bacterium]
MAEIVHDCPRCGAGRITFTVGSANEIPAANADWQRRFEVFSICRRCNQATIFVLRLHNFNARDLLNQNGFWTAQFALNDLFEVRGFVGLANMATAAPPEHVPEEIARIFREGATCLALECFNAASTMFRLCLDLATRPLLPTENDDVPQPNGRQRRDLGLRLPWLIENGRLPETLGQLAAVVREDGNDGAHVGNLQQEDADDLKDFTEVLLERLFTEPARLRMAEERRVQRRGVAPAD